MPEPVVFRPRGGQILAWVAIVVCAASLVLILVTDGPLAVVLWSSPLVLIAWIAWLLYVRPSVTVSDGFVEIDNPFRTHRIPWGDIDDIDTRFALTVTTTGGRRIRAWAAPAPGIRRALATRREEVAESPGDGDTRRPSDAAGTESGDASLIVHRRLDEYRRTGGAGRTGGSVSTLGVARIAVTSVLLAASVVTLSLTLPHG
ncbi:PH domain-containing protein [Microbacterium koreense]|uniref:PH domain-containing protein n=1 Tax=Microbacterium koreense TaxID=323761 RepID=A0ABW2ZSC6_9MICO